MQPTPPNHSSSVYSDRLALKDSPDSSDSRCLKLVAIHEAESLDNLRNPHGNRLEPLRGGLDGFHPIQINNQWRIIFRWEGKDAHEVKITDYH